MDDDIFMDKCRIIKNFFIRCLYNCEFPQMYKLTKTKMSEQYISN